MVPNLSQISFISHWPHYANSSQLDSLNNKKEKMNQKIENLGKSNANSLFVY